MYEERFYRNFERTDTVAYQVSTGESDLFIRTDTDLQAVAQTHLNDVRAILQDTLARTPEFGCSFSPVPARPDAHPVIHQMVQAALRADVGPMAAVAGMVSEYVGVRLCEQSSQVIIENGGDLFLKLSAPLVVGIYAGTSPLSGKIGITVHPTKQGLGLCTSSGTVGHSHSDGQADAVTVLSADTALADAVATAIGNRVKTSADVNPAIEVARSIEQVAGICIVIGDTLGIWGDLEITKL